ncbi:MAG: serine/threonine-protein kinase, partial [Pseudomonadota bacterium]
MDGPRWDKMWEVFHAALALTEDERAAFIADTCADDAALASDISALVDGHADADDMLATELEVPAAVAAAKASPHALIGQHIDNYLLRGVIGEGGMGVVYDAAQDRPVQRRVALKLIKLGMDTREVIARFENERQALALMSHPNIANVLDAGVTTEGRPYFVMEHVAGVPIHRYCDDHRLTVDERLRLFIVLCQAIEHAHQKGIIHRDIKPSNVLVTLQDNVPAPKVIDFGVAKALNQRLTDNTLQTELGRFVGTPEYMSPEQAESSGLDIDTRTDIYSLGVLLHYLLCGTLPFDGDALTSGDYATVREAIRGRELRRPSDQLDGDPDTAMQRRSDAATLRRTLRGDIDWIVMRALDPDRTRRYQTAGNFAADIQRYLKNEPVLAGPPSGRYRLKKFVQRHRVGVASAALALLTLAAFTAIMTWQSVRLSRALTVADQESTRAQQENARAQAVVEFLVELFEETDPGNARGREVTVREVLDRGSERLATELPEQPLVKATLRETVGG